MASNDRQKHCKPLQIVLRVQLFGNCQLMLQVRMTVFSPAKVQKSPQNVNARPERPKLEARKAKCGGWGWRSWQQAFLLPAKESGGAVSSFSGLRGERQKILILFYLFYLKNHARTAKKLPFLILLRRDLQKQNTCSIKNIVICEWEKCARFLPCGERS